MLKKGDCGRLVRLKSPGAFTDNRWDDSLKFVSVVWQLATLFSWCFSTVESCCETVNRMLRIYAGSGWGGWQLLKVVSWHTLGAIWWWKVDGDSQTNSQTVKQTTDWLKRGKRARRRKYVWQTGSFMPAAKGSLSEKSESVYTVCLCFPRTCTRLNDHSAAPTQYVGNGQHTVHANKRWTAMCDDRWQISRVEEKSAQLMARNESAFTAAAVAVDCEMRFFAEWKRVTLSVNGKDVHLKPENR